MLTRFKNTLIAVALLLGLALPGMASAQQTTTVTVIGFSDYHSHAVPFYSEGAANQAGVARTIGYLKDQRKLDPNILVLNGGDMLNKGSPTWSDEYQCKEWPWFNGLVDAMALGNHDVDYGQDAFKNCQGGIDYPVLSANYTDSSGNSLLLSGGKPYLVKEVKGIKFGLFALAGSDFSTLIAKANLPEGAKFADRTATARQVVSALRDTEKVDVVVLFGHASREDDTRLAQEVPGIDLIMGTHSHFKGELTQLPNSRTYYISPFQYLTYLSRVELTFNGRTLAGAKGSLVKMDQTLTEDPTIASQVTQMQKDLEAKHPDRFKVLGTAAVELSDHNISTDETVLGNWAMDVVRSAAGTHAFFSTSSSFRASIPPGPITVEAFFAAIPYKNSIVTADMTGQQLADLINLSLSKRGSDNFSQLSGVRFKVNNGTASDIQVLADPANPSAGYAPLDPAKMYKVGTTNFQALVSGVYKDLFAKAANVTDTKRDIGTLLMDRIQTDGTVTAALDGRMGTAVQAQPAPQATATSLPEPAAAATPATGGVSGGSTGATPGMPTTGSSGSPVWPVFPAAAAALAMLVCGYLLRAKAGRKHS